MNAFFFFFLSCSLQLISLSAADIILSKEPPVAIPQSHGGIDFLEVDQQRSRLLIPHAGNGTLDVFETKSGKFLKFIPTGAAQDVAIDPNGQKYYAAVSKEKQLVCIDAKTLEVTDKIPLSGPADILAFDPKTDTAYIGHDDAAEVWAVDVHHKNSIAAIPIPEGPEGIVFDQERERVYANAKSGDVVVVINTSSKRVVATWPTAPALKPHGSAFDSKSNRLFVAGGNGKLVAIDVTSGKVVSSANIAPRVDEIAYDAGRNRIYCASGAGILSVVDATGDLKFLGDIPTPEGAHSVAVDQNTHGIWIAYSEGKAGPSFIQCLK